MKTSKQLLMLGMLSALSAAASAAEGTGATGPAAVDTSQWKCESCKFEPGMSGTLDVGVGAVSDKAGKFGEYNGLDKQGGYFIGGGSARSRDADGSYWNLDASNLGLDSRSLNAEGGRQGSYKLLLKYDGLPHIISDNAQTPFSGNGGDTLTLPGGVGSLQTVGIGTERKRLGVGASWIPVRDWEYALNFRHETKDGSKRTAGSFFVNAAQLVEPVDYVTDQVDASASYSGKKSQFKLAYYGSIFRNGNQSLTWQDPYPPIDGEIRGRLALAPANQFHQILASAGYQFSERTRATADIAFGRMTQDSSFLPYVIDGPVTPPSVNARARTLDAALKLSSVVTSKLRLNAAFTRNDRDNQTPQASYAVVTTDMPTFIGPARTNLPYSFTQDKLKLSADYRASAALRGSVGADFDWHKRTFQEVDRTREDTAWGKISARINDKVDLSLKLAHGERRMSGTYQSIAAITTAENPVLRRYSMANRSRDSAGLRADFAAADTVTVGIGAAWARDAYTDSPVGLNSGSDFNLSGDVSAALTPQTHMHFFLNHQEIESKQYGSRAFSAADWSG